MTELRDSIAHYETHFTSLMSEINAIKSGSLDTAIQAELRAVLARKYGKRLLDSWVPPSEDEVKAAVEAGRMDESEEKAVEDVEMAETREVEQTQLPSSARKPAVIVGPADQSEERQMEDAQTAEEQEVEASPVQTKRPSSARRVTVDHGLASKSGSRSMEQGQQSKGEELSREQSKRSPSAPASELSPPPSVAITHSPSIHEEPSTRTSKRKASRPPRDAPKTKRSGKRAVSAVPTQPEIEIASEAGDPEPEAEVEPDAEESVPPALGRRASRRGRPKKALQSPTASTRTKESSPAVSRRAPSVSSTTSATPLGSARRGKGRGMRDEVVSKIDREQSAAASVKEEAEDDAAEGVTRRSGRRAKAELEEKKENLAEKRNRKGKRGSLQSEFLHLDPGQHARISI